MARSSKPMLLLDQHFRTVGELFSSAAHAELNAIFDIRGGFDRPMRRSEFLEHLPEAAFVVAAKPEMNAAELAAAKRLKAVIEVSGTFQDGLDYSYCFENGIEVLSCSPGFRCSVAEMVLALLLAACRGVVDEHERFRVGKERWFDDLAESAFTLYGQTVGFVGYGEIARECARLLEPFSPTIKAFDPWLAERSPALAGVELCGLEELATTCRVVIVAAVPTDENFQLFSRQCVERLPAGAVVVLASRAHLVDFGALVDAANDGKIRFAADVFPSEPVDPPSSYRSARNVIWSPHRAAAVDGGRHPIGEMIVHDCRNILAGEAARRLKAADSSTVYSIVRAPLAAA